MTVVEWDKVGERFFQTGLDRGVLYLKDASWAAWNGLVDLEDSSNSELTSYYLDGVKILDHVTPSDFIGKLKAITYPEEFDRVTGNGVAGDHPGLFYHEQPPKSFNLTYRTKIGNDVDGENHGYKIHLLYNLVAVPESVTFESIAQSVNPTEFAWTLAGTPIEIPGFRPAVHISVDSTRVYPDVLRLLEDILYGTDTTDPRMPLLSEVTDLITGTLFIIDNGDGTWTAIDTSDDEDFLTMLDSTSFEIHDADATYSDPDTYDISSTNLP